MNTPHLDDELLSALLDGEHVEEAGHMADCADCRARLDVLRSVSTAVATPVPPPPAEQRDAAVAAAVRAARVVPLQARRRRLTVLAAAAAVVAVLGSLAVLTADDDKGGETTTALGSDNGAPTFEGGDLGDQSDPAELALRLRAAVEPENAATAEGGVAAGDAATAAPTARLSPTSKSAQSEQQALTGPDPDCTHAAVRDYGANLGPLSYRASVRWKGTPAVVLVYAIKDATGSLDHQVLVMARGDCHLLVAQAI